MLLDTVVCCSVQHRRNRTQLISWLFSADGVVVDKAWKQYCSHVSAWVYLHSLRGTSSWLYPPVGKSCSQLVIVTVPPVCVTLTILSQPKSANKPSLTSSTSAWTFQKTSTSAGSSVEEQQCVCLLLCLIALLPLTHLPVHSLLRSLDGILLELLSPRSVQLSICIFWKIQSLFPACIGSLHSSQRCNAAVPGEPVMGR